MTATRERDDISITAKCTRNSHAVVNCPLLPLPPRRRNRDLEGECRRQI